MPGATATNCQSSSDTHGCPHLDSRYNTPVAPPTNSPYTLVTTTMLLTKQATNLALTLLILPLASAAAPRQFWSDNADDSGVGADVGLVDSAAAADKTITVTVTLGATGSDVPASQTASSDSAVATASGTKTKTKGSVAATEPATDVQTDSGTAAPVTDGSASATVTDATTTDGA